MHELFCNCVLVQDLFSCPYQNRLTLHSERKCLVYQAAAGTLMRGVKGGLVKGSTNNSFAFQKSQNKIIVIIDLWSLPPVCSYKFLREASCRCAWVQWSMFSYIKRLKNEVKIKYQEVVTVVWTKWWFNLFNWSLMYFFNWSLYFVNSA